ncbi:MAG: methyltransferase domain-containing protein [Lachnospiraceae bacterium]|nr:methyltransferase domain-containing protein [Lachnospiraceae bacterium]
MNTIWSNYIQGPKTLYYSRKLRFDDMFREQYKALFGLEEGKKLKILEIGCGPGALAGALHRWYPEAEITAIDRDSEFIAFAKEHEPGIRFMEGDATELPFEEGSFDVTISNTVSEHIEPGVFYGEQLRVLKPGGVCLVLSARKGVHVYAKCLAKRAEEEAFWKKVEQYDDTMERFSICKYPMSEAELPLALQTQGFQNVSTGYAAINLTPDHPAVSSDMAQAMINANCYTALEAVESVLRFMPGQVTEDECQVMKDIVVEKYDTRIAQYNRGEKQWDTNVNITMVVRGEK